MIKRIVLLVCLFFFYIFPIHSKANLTFWDIKGNVQELHINEKTVFSSKTPLTEIPKNLSPSDKIDFGFYVGEYFILKSESENFSNLLTLLNSEGKEYQLLTNLLVYYWELEKGESKKAEAQLDSYIQSESSEAHSHMAALIKQFTDKKTNYSLNKSDIQKLSCLKAENYMNLCRVIKFRLGLELVIESDSNTHRHYTDLDRALAPFFEESNLGYVPFLEKVIPDVSAKLAYIGMAGEAIHFQKMQLENEKLSNRFEIISYERLSFYHMLNGDLESAESTLDEALQNLKATSILKNSILLKAGSIAYLRKDYKKSLKYFTDLNMKYWGRTMRHPINDENISPYSARNLIAYVISKAINPATAIKALNKLKTKKPDEEDLFIQLRIAHILFPERPKITEKITDDIIYIAQSKGWKRVEYAATLLNGYTNIINRKNRRSVIQFTKSYGILGKSDHKFRSEWIRQSGMLLGRLQGKERGRHDKSFHSLIEMMRKNEYDYDILSVNMFLDRRFGPEEVTEKALDFFRSRQDYSSFLSTLYYSQYIHSRDSFHNSSLLQIPSVLRRLKVYKGFRPSIDNLYFKSKQIKNLKIEAKEISKNYNKFDDKVLNKIKTPFLAVIPFNGKVYVVAYKPDRKANYRWSILNFSEKQYGSVEYYEKIISSFPWIEGDNSFQIYLNQQGAELYQILRKNKISYNIKLFYNFQTNSDSSETQLNPVTAECSQTDKLEKIQYLPSDYFEGTKTLNLSNTLQIWNFQEFDSKISGSSNSIESYSWKCGNSNVRFEKLQRRVDDRNLPNAILITNTILKESTSRVLAKDYMKWTDFWMKKGVSTIYFIDRLEQDEIGNEILELISVSNPGSSNLNKLSKLLKQNSREGVVLNRGPI